MKWKGKRDTHAHVEGDRNEHGLAREHDEGTAEDVLDTLTGRHCAALERSPIPVISSLFPQLLCTFDQNDRTGYLFSARRAWRITRMKNVHEGLGQCEKCHDQACPSKESEQPEHPTPRNSSNGHEATNSGPECRAGEWRKSEQRKCLPTRVCVPNIRHYGSG